jgi:hypothetical protein
MADHRAVLVVLESTSGSGSFGVEAPTPPRAERDLGPSSSGGYRVGAPGWALGPALSAGATSTVNVSCTPETTFVARWYDAPAAPTTFSGSGTQSIAFVAPTTAAYAASIEVSSGSVTLSRGAPERLRSSGEIQLGPLRQGEVVPVKMSGTAWKVTFGAFGAPALKGGLVGAPPFTRPGHSFSTWYVMIRKTKLTATVLDSHGTVVRTLLSDVPVVSKGQIVWDSRGPDGRTLPEGRYTIHVESHEPVSDGSDHVLTTAETSTVLDATAPAVRLRKPSRATRQLVVSVSDALSGLSVANVHVDGHKVATIPAGKTRTTYRPRHGWAPGRHRVVVYALDTAANLGKTTRHFTIARRGQ